MTIQPLGQSAICRLDSEDRLGLEFALRYLERCLTARGDEPTPAESQQIELLAAVLKAGSFRISTPAGGGMVEMSETGWAVCGALYNHDTAAYAQWCDMLLPWTLPFPRRL